MVSLNINITAVVTLWFNCPLLKMNWSISFYTNTFFAAANVFSPLWDLDLETMISVLDTFGASRKRYYIIIISEKIICANGFNRIWCVWMKHHFSATTCLLPWIFVIVATTQSMSWWCEAGKEEKEYDGMHKYQEIFVEEQKIT